MDSQQPKTAPYKPIAAVQTVCGTLIKRLRSRGLVSKATCGSSKHQQANLFATCWPVHPLIGLMSHNSQTARNASGTTNNCGCQPCRRQATVWPYQCCTPCNTVTV